jgi:nucleotide-binding universal stress UspA family protein
VETRTILCPIDFSTLGNAALETATALARDRDAKLLIVHVQEPAPAYMNGEFYYGIEEPDRQELKKMLKKVLPTDPAVGYKHRLVTGNPAEAIVDLAAAENAEMIVLATHGRTGLPRLIMGSVAEEVVRRAKCPVLTVKAPPVKPAPVRAIPTEAIV